MPLPSKYVSDKIQTGMFMPPKNGICPGRMFKKNLAKIAFLKRYHGIHKFNVKILISLL